MAIPGLAVQVNGVAVISDDNLNTFVQGGCVLANLRNFTGLTSMTVYMIGAITPGDGQQGTFYWNSGSFQADDGGVTCIAPYGVLTGRWLRLSGESISGVGNVLNIAALRALSSVIAPAVFVDGYYTGADGGEGMFWYNAADTTTPDNGGTIIVDGAGQRWYRETGGGPLSVRWFGATGNGTTNDTAAIQACFNVGNAWHFPPGNYVFGGLTLPYEVGFDLGGCGQSSVLVQKGAGISFANLPTGIFGASATIHDLSFNGTNGTNATLNMTFAQEYDLINLYFTEVPPGDAALILNGNTNDGTYMHDCRVRGLRIYCGDSGTGNIGLHLGAYASDTLIEAFEMQAAFTCNYCCLAESGAQTTNFSNCHIYNAKVNNVGYENGGGNLFTWTNCRFDYALSQSIFANNSFDNQFVNCWFEAITAGNNGVVLSNCAGFTFVACMWTSLVNSAGYANGCVTESGSCAFNKVIGGFIDNASYYDDPFNMPAADDCVSNVANFITQQKGQVSGSTQTLVITHNLNVTPNNDDFTVTPVTALGSATNYWVSGANSTSATISMNEIPGQSVTFAWAARALGS
jgi:hypothetical protein